LQISAQSELRDYWADVEACIASKNPSFRLTSLTVWEDIIEPPVLPASLRPDDSADVLAAQEQALASRFNEIKIKLAGDCAAMAEYNQNKSKLASKLHVLKVLHEKAQLASGRKQLVLKTFATHTSPKDLSGTYCFCIVQLVQKIIVFVSAFFPNLRVVDDFMASSCWMGLVGDMAIPTDVDRIIRLTAAKKKAGCLHWMAFQIFHLDCQTFIYLHHTFRIFILAH